MPLTETQLGNHRSVRQRWPIASSFARVYQRSPTFRQRDLGLGYVAGGWKGKIKRGRRSSSLKLCGMLEIVDVTMDCMGACIVCRVKEICGLQGLPRLRMLIARRTPSTVEAVCERCVLGRTAAHHRSRKLHGWRRLHLRGMDRT
jgi:hypothetical protein